MISPLLGVPQAVSPQNNSTVLLNASKSSFNFSIDCIVELEPRPSSAPPINPNSTSFEWYRNGQSLNGEGGHASDPTVTVVMHAAGSRLMVAGSNATELFGVYQCFVSNLAGTAVSTTRVLPHGETLYFTPRSTISLSPRPTPQAGPIGLPLSPTERFLCTVKMSMRPVCG